MNENEAYDAWTEERAGAEPPPGFADRVMERVRVEPGPSGAHPAPLSPRRLGPATAAVLAAGVGLGVLRTASLLLFVLFSPGRGY